MHQCIPSLTPINKIKYHFNRAAHSYDEHSQLQKSTGKKLINLCKNFSPSVAGILDLGCGTGFTTEQIAKSYIYQKFHAIDIANLLLMKAKKRLRPYKISIYEKDFDTFHNSNENFDLIFSNMALQWSTNLQNTLYSLYDLLSVNGCLAFSIPLKGSLSELQSDYSINAFFDSSFITDILIKHNFQILYHNQDRLTYPFSSTREALISLKKVGANHVKKRLHSGLFTRLNFQHINQLTYVIGYFVTRRSCK